MLTTCVMVWTALQLQPSMWSLTQAWTGVLGPAPVAGCNINAFPNVIWYQNQRGLWGRQEKNKCFKGTTAINKEKESMTHLEKVCTPTLRTCACFSPAQASCKQSLIGTDPAESFRWKFARSCEHSEHSEHSPSSPSSPRRGKCRKVWSSDASQRTSSLDSLDKHQYITYITYTTGKDGSSRV